MKDFIHHSLDFHQFTKDQPDYIFKYHRFQDLAIENMYIYIPEEGEDPLLMKFNEIIHNNDYHTLPLNFSAIDLLYS